ncbi:protein of unknown function [Streptococcus sanguinis]|uniref:Uncharacterized protein n=1 Tax=Streptococcus sanguinis TaxID=1305 RepID=A0A0B7GMW4_STRSA|nr:protein of unknown function [Streptococcus sanguinis]
MNFCFSKEELSFKNQKLIHLEFIKNNKNDLEKKERKKESLSSQLN